MDAPLIRFDVPPCDLGADEAGPFWLVEERGRHSRSVRILEPIGSGVRSLGAFPMDRAPRFGPRLVAGARAVLHRHERLLCINGEPVSMLTGEEWEHFAAVETPVGRCLRAFAAGRASDDPGYGFAVWTGLKPFVRPLQPPGIFAPRGAVSAGWVAFGMRLGGSAGTEVTRLSKLEAGLWQPTVAKAVPPRSPRDAFFGDPAIALDPQGRVHWAAALWRRFRKSATNLVDYSWQLGPVFVDGAEVARGAADPGQPAKTTLEERQWLPALAWTRHGLAAAWQSAMPEGREPGEVTVGLVRDGRIVEGSTRSYPGFGPLLAAHEGRTYLATSYGLWASG